MKIYFAECSNDACSWNQSFAEMGDIHKFPIEANYFVHEPI